jgi:hypothetical protein
VKSKVTAKATPTSAEVAWTTVQVAKNKVGTYTALRIRVPALVPVRATLRMTTKPRVVKRTAGTAGNGRVTGRAPTATKTSSLSKARALAVGLQNQVAYQVHGLGIGNALLVSKTSSHRGMPASTADNRNPLIREARTRPPRSITTLPSNLRGANQVTGCALNAAIIALRPAARATSAVFSNLAHLHPTHRSPPQATAVEEEQVAAGTCLRTQSQGTGCAPVAASTATRRVKTAEGADLPRAARISSPMGGGGTAGAGAAAIPSSSSSRATKTTAMLKGTEECQDSPVGNPGSCLPMLSPETGCVPTRSVASIALPHGRNVANVGPRNPEEEEEEGRVHGAAGLAVEAGTEEREEEEEDTIQSPTKETSLATGSAQIQVAVTFALAQGAIAGNVGAGSPTLQSLCKVVTAAATAAVATAAVATAVVATAAAATAAVATTMAATAKERVKVKVEEEDLPSPGTGSARTHHARTLCSAQGTSAAGVVLENHPISDPDQLRIQLIITTASPLENCTAISPNGYV